jgi:hypothetical protein
MLASPGAAADGGVCVGVLGRLCSGVGSPTEEFAAALGGPGFFSLVFQFGETAAEFEEIFAEECDAFLAFFGFLLH